MAFSPPSDNALGRERHVSVCIPPHLSSFVALRGHSSPNEYRLWNLELESPSHVRVPEASFTAEARKAEDWKRFNRARRLSASISSGVFPFLNLSWVNTENDSIYPLKSQRQKRKNRTVEMKTRQRERFRRHSVKLGYDRINDEAVIFINTNQESFKRNYWLNI